MAYADPARRRAYENEKKERKRARWKSEGLCVRCGKPATVGCNAGITLCDYHRAWSKSRTAHYRHGAKGKLTRARWYNQRVEAGRCRQCGKPLPSNATRRACAACLKVGRDYHRERRPPRRK